MQQRLRPASVLGLSTMVFLWLSGCHDDPELLGELMTGGTTQAAGKSSQGGALSSSGGPAHGGTMSTGGAAAHGGHSASGGAQNSSGGAASGGVATDGGASVTQGGSGIVEAGASSDAGASSAGNGNLPDSCGTTRCDAPLVCIATRVIGGALQFPDDAGNCPQGRHPESVGSTIHCENDFSYRCVAPSGCGGDSLSCACGAATCPSEYPSCFDPGSDATMLSPATALVCELLAP